MGLNRVVRGEMLGMTRMGHSGARYAGSTIYRGGIVQGGGDGMGWDRTGRKWDGPSWGLIGLDRDKWDETFGMGRKEYGAVLDGMGVGMGLDGKERQEVE